MAHALQAEKAEMEQHLRESPEENPPELMCFAMSHLDVHHELVPRALRHSQLLALYAVLEHQLVELCKALRQRDPSLSLKISDLSGTGAIACEIFLTKVVEAKISNWSKIHQLRRLRNCIAHTNGRIDSLERGKEAVRKIIQADPDLRETDGVLIVTSPFISKAQKWVSQLFDEAFENLGLKENPFALSAPDGFVIQRNEDGAIEVSNGKEVDLPK
tara:strand:- start:837 stop:1484 length:648 start_codon:yes stop_codon:yes gene_type:complete